MVEVPEQEVRVARAGMPIAAIPMVILSALLLLYGVCIFSTGIGLFHDDGIYVVTAKSLAEGRGYQIDSYPRPLAQTKYPPVLPLILSVVWRMFPKFPDNIPLLKLVSVASLIGWAWICFCFFSQCLRVSRTVAFWLLVAVLVNPWSLFGASAILTEHLYAALALASLMLLGRKEIKFVWWAAILAGLAYLTRTAGVAVIGAGVVALAAQKRWKHAAVYAATALPFLTGWMLWQHANASASGNPTEAYYTAQNYTDWNLLIGSSFERSQAVRIGVVDFLCILTFPARVMLSLPFDVKTSVAAQLFVSLLVWVLAIRGLRRMGREALPWALYAAASFGIMIAWAWQPDRLVLPVLPILAGLAFVGSPRRVPPALLALLLVFPLLTVMLAGSRMVRYGTPAFADPPWAIHDERYAPPSDWKKVRAVYDWINEHAPPQAVILANYDPGVYLYTGHKSIRPFAVDPGFLFYGVKYEAADKIPAFLSLVDRYHPQYLVETGREAVEEASYQQIVQDLTQEGILEIAADIAPGYRVYAVREPRGQ